MSKVIPLAMMLTSCSWNLLAQSSSILLGSRANGLGYATSCLEDEWSIFNNIAGLAKVKHVSAAFTVDAHPEFRTFNRAAAVFVFPNKVTSGIGLFHFGDDLYREELVTAGFASSIGNTSLGINANLVQYNVTGIGRKSVFTFSLGGVTTITPRFSVGAYITNVNQPFLSKSDGERIPTRMAIGARFNLSEKASAVVEVQKDISYRPTLKAGVEYQVGPSFSATTGVNLYPAAGFFGVGFHKKKFKAGYAYSYLPEIAGRHQCTVGYQLSQPR